MHAFDNTFRHVQTTKIPVNIYDDQQLKQQVQLLAMMAVSYMSSGFNCIINDYFRLLLPVSKSLPIGNHT